MTLALTIISTIIVAVIIDRFFGEPQKLHPLVGFGNLTTKVERQFNTQDNNSALSIIVGGFSAALLIAPWLIIITLLKASISSLTLIGFIVDIVILYWAIGHQSLREHAQRVIEPLIGDDLSTAQQQLAMIVSRDTQQLNDTQIAQATIETVLENGSDAIFAPIFWFFCGQILGNLGAPFVILYRLVNTLDAMWGYRNERFNYFGRFVARFDDILNYLPARLVAISYALLGNTQLAFQCWREQAPLLNSPNAGPVMAAGAGSLNLRLGGPASYHNTMTNKPYFGSERIAAPKDIDRSLQLVRNTLLLWCGVLCLLSLTIAAI